MKKLIVALVAFLMTVPVLAQKGKPTVERKDVTVGAPIHWAAKPTVNFEKLGGAKRSDFIVILKKDFPANDHAVDVARGKGQLDRIWTQAANGFLVRGVNKHALRGLARNPKVEYIEQNGVVGLGATQTGTTWGLDRIDQVTLSLDGNHDYNYDYDGTGVHVYILDSGVLDTHINFGGRVTQEVNYAGGSNSDCHGHGTHVAGTVGASTYGVAKNVTLHGIKVLDCNGLGTTADVISGIDWVTNHHLSPAVANLSLSGGASVSLDNAVNNSVAAGVFYAVAAGNGNSNACNYSPARAADAVTVGSTTSSDARSSFSNYGPCLDIFAPGSSITSTWNTSNSATKTISGTSMASPHVAGAAALILDQFPAFTPAQVEAEMLARATSGVVSSPGSGSPNQLLYSLSSGGGGGCILTEATEVSCSDGFDNDCDGTADGTDFDCALTKGICPAGYTRWTGTATPGGSLVTPGCEAGGAFHAILTCNVGSADLDVYFDQYSCGWWSCGFLAVGSSTGAGCNEEININGGANIYRWRILHYSGPDEGFVLCTNQC